MTQAAFDFDAPTTRPRPMRRTREYKIRLGNCYEARYVMPDSSNRTFTVWAFNKSDASSAAYLRLRELVGDDAARTAWAHGIERRTW